MAERLDQARERQKAAKERSMRTRIGPPLDLTDAELDEMAAITTRDQQLALAHAKAHGTHRFVALLEAVDDTDPPRLDPNITS